MQVDIYSLLVILGILAIIVEIILGAATGFDLFIIGVVLIIGGFSGSFFHSIQAAIVTVTILLLTYLVLGRSTIKGALSVKTHKSNIDSLMGREAIVVKKIEAHKTGQIKSEGEVWRAEADSFIDEGKSVIIESVNGVTLKVKPKEE